MANLVPPTSATFIAGIPNELLLHSTGAITPVSWTLMPDPNASWLKLKDNGDGTALLTGTPPVGRSLTFLPKIGPVAYGSFALIEPFPVFVENTPVFISPNTATFTVGKGSGFGIQASQGDITLVGVLPAGLTFNASVGGLFGAGAVISGNPAAGTGGQYTVDLVVAAPRTNEPTTQQLTLNINEAPQFTGPCPSANCTVEVPLGGTFTVTTTGFPSMSSRPLSASEASQGGNWMSFVFIHLPPGAKATNLNAEGFATGTLTIQAPTEGLVGQEWLFGAIASNGVKPDAQKDIYIKIVRPSTTPAP